MIAAGEGKGLVMVGWQWVVQGYEIGVLEGLQSSGSYLLYAVEMDHDLLCLPVSPILLGQGWPKKHKIYGSC